MISKSAALTDRVIERRHVRETPARAASVRKAIVLGAGHPFRGQSPSALSETENHWSVLDWLSDAFSVIGADLHLVGGYRLSEIARRYPDLPISANTEWRETGPVESLFLAPLSTACVHYVCYSDTVFSKESIARMEKAKGDIVLAADSQWRRRYGNRSASDIESAEKISADGTKVTAIRRDIPVDEACAEFTGLMRLSDRALARLMRFRSEERARFRNASLPQLLEAFLSVGFDIGWVDIEDNWAELNAPTDLSRFVLGTKAETLERLRPLVAKSAIGEQVAVTQGDWHKNRERCLSRISEKLTGRKLIVRSSAVNEDGWDAANAGAYLSLLNVPAAEPEKCAGAIDDVFASYGDENDHHQVLIQKMITDVAVSGVVFTRTLSFGGPYYTINYDESSARPDTVTSGAGDALKTLIINRQANHLPDESNPLLHGLLPAVRELETLVAHDTLDIEFIISSDGVVHIVQLRPIAVDHGRWRGGSDRQVGALLDQAVDAYKALSAPGPFVLGEQTLFSNMSDWNPAEIIGTRPRPLALSLYRSLVTDEIWARQRAEYGYRDVRPQRLMAVFAGQPYIDVRASFNSFIPVSLDDDLASRLVAHYHRRLSQSPATHDKIEFDIVFSCMTLDFENASSRLSGDGFSEADIRGLREALSALTNTGLKRCDHDLAQIEILNQRRQRILKSNLTDLDKALSLLEDCQRYGSLPFAHLARAGFVAVSLLRSAVNAGIVPADMAAEFMRSVETVATRFSDDASGAAKDKGSWERLIADYGHLRPGTYEITSPCYRSDPDFYLRPLADGARGADAAKESWRWPEDIRRALDASFANAGLDIDCDGFDAFARTAIEGREYAKFCFTRNLSDALEAIAAFGATAGLNRETLSYIEREDLVSLAGGMAPSNPGEWLKARARENKDLHNLSHGIELPPVIAKEADFEAFCYPESHPNFVSSGVVSAAIVCLDNQQRDDINLENRIVLIRQADPGYDWLFGYPIAGLITAYGGANSHMAIRAAEFDLPAAIGVGERMYEQLAGANIIRLDCQNRNIEIVR